MISFPSAAWCGLHCLIRGISPRKLRAKIQPFMIVKWNMIRHMCSCTPGSGLEQKGNGLVGEVIIGRRDDWLFNDPLDSDWGVAVDLF